MGSAVEHGDIIGLIYDAALDPELWPTLLERISDLVGGAGAILMWQNQISGEGLGVTARFDPEATEAFFGHFAARNPLRPPADYIRRAVRAFRPSIITDESRLPKSDLMRTEFYNDFMRPFDFHSTVSIGLAAEGLEGATVDVTKPRRRGGFTEEQLAVCAALQPHLVRAFELNRRLAGAHPVGEDLAAVLDRVPAGVFVVAETGRVLYANRAAERSALSRSDPGMADARLRAPTAEATRRLHALIDAAASRDPRGRRGGAMIVEGSTGRVSVTVTPSRSGYHSVFHRDPAVIVCVTDLEAPLDLPEQKLHDLFGLSRAEGRVAAALFDGLDPRETAERLNLSVHTVRGHLARIFEKTGVSGQVGLARLMMRAIGIGAG